MSSFSQELKWVLEVWVRMVLSTKICGDHTQDINFAIIEFRSPQFSVMDSQGIKIVIHSDPYIEKQECFHYINLVQLSLVLLYSS